MVTFIFALFLRRLELFEGLFLSETRGAGPQPVPRPQHRPGASPRLGLGFLFLSSSHWFFPPQLPPIISEVSRKNPKQNPQN